MAEENDQADNDATDDDDTGTEDGTEEESKGEGDKGESETDRLRRALKRANAEAKKYRLATKTAPKDDDIEARIAAARDEATEAANTTWGQRFIKSEARAALVAAGAVNAKRAVNLLAVDDLDLDDDGEVIGLEAAIRDLRKEMPELFRAKNTGTDHKSDGKGPAKDESKLTATERQARQLAGQL